MTRWLLFLSICFLSSCIDPPPPRLNKVKKNELDSLYKASLNELDSLAEEKCAENHVSMYQAAIDSIQNVRREEIESILGQ